MFPGVPAALHVGFAGFVLGRYTQPQPLSRIKPANYIMIRRHEEKRERRGDGEGTETERRGREGGGGEGEERTGRGRR